jgi:plastocyanin
MRRLVPLLLITASVLVWALPASAATVNVSIVDFAFSPTTVKAAMGSTVTWTNTGAANHTSTQDDPLDLWVTGTITPSHSASTTLTAAGTYAYHCSIHTFMTGKVKVPGAVSPSSGTIATTFTITVATVAAPNGFVYDVQMKIGSGSFSSFKRGLTTTTTTFHPSVTGTYAFRSRLRDIGSTPGASGWSPAKTITVS